MTTKATNNGLKSLPFERRSSVKSIIGIWTLGPTKYPYVKDRNKKLSSALST
jgi:hypothetical protein